MRICFTTVWVLLLCNFSHLSAQTKPKFTDEETKKFATIYRHFLDKPFDLEQSMRKGVAQIKISETRFTEIFQAQATSTNIALTDTEKREMNKLKVLMQADKDLYDKQANEYIQKQGLSLDRYNKMLSEFNNNKTFQQKIIKLNQ